MEPEECLKEVRTQVQEMVDKLDTYKLSDQYLSNASGDMNSEWIMIGQNYEDLHVAHHCLKRFLEQTDE